MSSVYNDDEVPTEPPPSHASTSGVLVLDTQCEYPAVPNDAAHDGFAVMVHVKAPALVTAAPLDLVAVLDITESMASNLAQVKRAMAFVIDNLGPRDRLSVVAFSAGARRVLRLTGMSAEGKAAAKSAVESLVAAGSAEVCAGLDEASKVLDDSRHHVASVILVSGGQSNTGHCNNVLVPPSLRPLCEGRCTPVHTFLLGSDSKYGHDAAAAMHNISEVTGGMFSFVEDHESIQDALARCIGGLLSTVVQDAWINVECWCEDMVVNAVKSGCYRSGVGDGFDCTRAAWVDAGDLYADEERRFLLFLDIPAADDANRYATRLVKVTCNYTDMASRQTVDVADVWSEVLRPINATPTDVARCLEVERELLRVAAAEDMALAREAAERSAYDEAARILGARRESLCRSAPALSGDATCDCEALAAELHELSQRVSDERVFQLTGSACLLAGVCSHARQRGSSVRLARPLSSGLQFGCPGSAMFVTPAMHKMEKLSEVSREQRQHAPEYGRSRDAGVVPPRSCLEARLPSTVPRLGVFQRNRSPVPIKWLANPTGFGLVRPSMFCPF